MRMRGPVFPGLVALLAVVVGPIHAQSVSFGISPHIGTMGVGADVGVGVHPRITLRAGGNFFPVEPEFEIEGIRFKVKAPSPQFMAVGDLFLTGSFRISGGMRYSSEPFAATGVLTENVEIGNTQYTPAEVGELTAEIVSRTLSPYLGIGFGNIAKRGFGFVFDIGAAFHGTPTTTLSATGLVAQADLDQQRGEMDEAVGKVKVYPVMSLGFRIGF